MNLIAFALTSVPLLIQLYSKLYRETDYSETLSELKGHAGLPKIDTYDFIIVGGGTAGCVLAGRLSSSFKVLLLETGGTPVPSTDSPFLTPQVGADTSINYFFTSTPQANAGQSNGGIIPVHTGKMLGGSGSHNDMVHSRGSPKDFDAIAQLTGDSSYSYASMIQHFKRSENFVGELVNPGEQDLYGKGGPLTLQTDMHASLPLWSAAGQELGYSYSDPNGYQREGFAPLQKLIDEKGRRVSTYNKYVQPYEDSRVNLTVLRYSTVSEILLDASNKAYGVAYKRHGIPQISHASKEVIISGGTFGTPLLLMRSGIGPRNVLEEANIPVKVESPEVGRNLNDHAYAFLSPITFNASALPFITRLDGDLEFQEALNKYQNGEPSFFGEFQEGPQVILVSSRAQASPQEREWPDSRILFDWSCGGTLDASAPLQACMWGELDRPRSRGSVKLNATAYQEGVEDDEQLLVLDWKMFDDPSDMDVLIEALEFGLRLVETTKAFQGLAATYTAGPISPCTSFTFRSKAYWQCYIRHYAGSAIHMVGTCSIGKVVDSNLRVVGTTNLRIVDASVLPNTPNANLNAPVIAIAEKAATNILAQYAFTA